MSKQNNDIEQSATAVADTRKKIRVFSVPWH